MTWASCVGHREGMPDETGAGAGQGAASLSHLVPTGCLALLDVEDSAVDTLTSLFSWGSFWGWETGQGIM